jgi:hypothetical protein
MKRQLQELFQMIKDLGDSAYSDRQKKAFKGL